MARLGHFGTVARNIKAVNVNIHDALVMKKSFGYFWIGKFSPLQHIPCWRTNISYVDYQPKIRHFSFVLFDIAPY